MGIHKNKSYPLRIDNNLMDKIKVIAKKEDRPVSMQLERIIKSFVENYERENGTIEIQDS